MQLVFVIPSLSGGGAERVLVSLARGLAARGHRVTVVTIYGPECDFFPLPEAIHRVALGLGRDTEGLVDKLGANLRRLAALRRAIRKARPEAVISFLGRTNVLTVFAAAGLKTPVIVAEHTDPIREPLPAPWQWLRRIAYRWAARVVSVSAAIDEYFDWIPAARRAVIPNPIDFAELARPAAPLKWPWPHAAIAMGRLAPEKGFDQLIEAFAAVASQFPDWGLVILGEGPLRGKLESLATGRGLAGRVLLPGNIPQPGATLKNADLFVLSSRWEALPMALLEAMACGLPSVVTQCIAGRPEWLQSGKNAILTPVDEVPKLAGALAELMRDAALRRRLGDNAALTARQFALESVLEQWEALLAEFGCRSTRPGV